MGKNLNLPETGPEMAFESESRYLLRAQDHDVPARNSEESEQADSDSRVTRDQGVIGTGLWGVPPGPGPGHHGIGSVIGGASDRTGAAVPAPGRHCHWQRSRRSGVFKFESLALPQCSDSGRG